jgi:two-component system, NarL family, sensor kinase
MKNKSLQSDRFSIRAAFRRKGEASTTSISDRSLIIGIFAIVSILDFSTPPDYVFGYLYTGAILIANSRIGQVATAKVTFVAVFLTMINIWIPGEKDVVLSAITDRMIAIISLVVTGWLSERNRVYQEAISQQKYQLDNQSELVRLREDFASTLTHDLKTPLLGAIEAIKILASQKIGVVTEIQQQVLTTMSRSHQTSLELVEALLDVYRNDSNGLELNLAPVDLTTLTEEVSSNLATLALAAHVNISINYGGSDFRQSLWVNGDEFQLKRVLTNLLINAIDHSRRGDRVEIVLESDRDDRVVKIIDRGSGITAEELPHLFTRFYQGNSHRQAKGTGLGLYLCRQIVAAHGGIIWAEHPPHRGAIFAFRLPSHSHSLDN